MTCVWVNQIPYVGSGLCTVIEWARSFTIVTEIIIFVAILVSAWFLLKSLFG